jgi:hypothetical protein
MRVSMLNAEEDVCRMLVLAQEEACREDVCRILVPAQEEAFR